MSGKEKRARGTKRRRCHGTNAAGERCKAPPSLVRDDNWCDAHRPDVGSAEMRRRGTKGGFARTQLRGISVDELGPLDSHQAAKRWLEAIGRAAVTGQLKDRAAAAGVRAVEAWLRAESERLTLKVVEELRTDIEELKAQMGVGTRLRSA